LKSGAVPLIQAGVYEAMAEACAVLAGGCLESVRGLHQGLHSFRKHEADGSEFEESESAAIEVLPILGRLTISVLRLGRTLPSAA
jgi:hypothetical protein